jgi:hypothetical protein
MADDQSKVLSERFKILTKRSSELKNQSNELSDHSAVLRRDSALLVETKPKRIRKSIVTNRPDGERRIGLDDRRVVVK